MLKTWEEVDAFIKKYPHTWEGRVCDICGNDRNNEVCLCHAHYKEVSALKKKHEALAASHRRLVEAVKKLNAVHCKISQVVMQSIPDGEGNDILAALTEAEELIKKEG